MGLNPANPRKMAIEDWDALASEIEAIFVPGTAIKEQELFAGRKEQISMLVSAVRRPGKHAIVYGERGVGKSSIAQTFYLSIPRLGGLNAIRVAASYGDTFSDLWRKVFRRMEGEDNARIDSKYPGAITPDDVFLELSKFHANDLSLIILDEIDRISDQLTKRLLADTIKALADEDIQTKLICVGVADSVGELILGHESASRALVQVEMRRMSDEEMRDLIVARLQKVNMSISGDALWRMIFVSKGLPFYGHLMGLYSALTAIKRRSLKIEERDVTEGLQGAIKEVDQKIREEYVAATYSERQKNIFKQVLLACALAERDDLGRFNAKSVADRLSIITGEKYEVPAFAYHLDEFCQETRGKILDKIGRQRQFSFRFRDSLMEAYVVLKSLELGLVSNEKAQVLGPNRQRDLFSI